MFNKIIIVLTGTFVVLCVVVPSAWAATMPRVIINELMWMGSSNSSSDEWIELRNTTADSIDLTNWRLTKLSSGLESTMLTIPSGNIPPFGIFVIANSPAEDSRLSILPDLIESDISLVNSKLQLSLYDSASALVDRADDGSGAPLAGEYVSGSTWKSMERTPQGVDGTLPESWHTAAVSNGFDDPAIEFGTPGTSNSNEAPVATVVHPDTAHVHTDVLFDASESVDPDHDPLLITWNFGDGIEASGVSPTHQYNREGVFTITVVVSDGMHDVQHQSVIAIVADDILIQAPNSNDDNPKSGSANTPLQSSQSILISELLPNPNGPDEEQEFIELINTASDVVNLRGWKITDTSKDFIIQVDVTLAGGETIAFARPSTGIALNNTSDHVFLVDPFGVVVNGVAYTKAESGKSFARDSKGTWVWTTPTPNEINLVEKLDDPTEEDDAEGSVKGDSIASVSIVDARTLPLRTKVTLRGTVIVMPDVFSTKLFYISDGKQSIAVDIGEMDGSFVLGSVIEITGKLGQASGERKINLGSDGNITILDQGNQVMPQAFDSSVPLGSFITLTGFISSMRGTSIWVTYNEQDVQVTAAKGADIEWGSLETGKIVTIVGVWRKSGESTRVYPRSQEDVVVAEAIDSATTKGGEQKSSDSKTQQIEQDSGGQSKHANNPYIGYGLPVLLVGGFAVYSWMRKRKEKLKS